MIITNNPYKIKLNQKIYDKIVCSINFDSISCDNCSHHHWTRHSYYSRCIDYFFGKLKIIITRIICCHCGKTHAILIEGMIPFSSLNFSDIINVLSSHNSDFVSPPHFYYLKHKYRSISLRNYHNFCLHNRRSFSIIFSTT